MSEQVNGGTYKKENSCILVVDDLTTNLKFLEAILSDVGYKVMTADSGAKALEIVEVSPPDLLLLDLLMPEMDGFEVCKTLKACEETRHIPVVFLSGSKDIKNITQAFVVGGVDYITKPFQQAEVVCRIDTHLNLRRTQAELRMVNQELERTHIKVAEANELQQTIFDSVRAEIFLRNANGYFLKVNKAAADTFGLERSEIEGRAFDDLNIPVPNEEYINDDEVLESGFSKQGVVLETCSRSNGKRWKLVDKLPFKDHTGALKGVVTTSIDITQQKKVESDLKERCDELALLNKAMLNLLEDNELINQQLLESKKNLEVSNQELKSFSHSVSHDLRAPLRSLDGFSRILLEKYDDKLDAQGKDYLKRIRDASQRMGNLIDALLGLSRITRQEMVKRKINLSSIVKKIVKDLRSEEPERKVEFVIAPEAEAVGDADLIRVVLENLLNNSWKFTRGKAKAKVEFGEIAEKERKVFFVRDNGAGFDMAYADKLFGAFQRLHSEKEFPGTGIGLSSVKRIIDRHDGEIWGEGVKGEGAVFYFTLGTMGA